MPRSVVWFLLCLWGQLFYAIHPWWLGETYYDFGWVVPLAAAWFFRERWRDLPSVTPTKSLRGLPLLVVVAGMGAFAFLALIRSVERSDPFWRVPVWLHALGVVAIHHATLAKYRCPPGFAWITVFALTAVPLPHSIEGRIIDPFTSFLIQISEPLANVLGLPVLRSGNALIANGEVLKIDEACSGIRSLQGLAMISLLCGELFRLSFAGRIGLLAMAPVCALVFNAVRAIGLTWVFFEQGQESFDSLHDSAGHATFACSVALTAGVGWLLKRRMERLAASDL